jgi:histidine ammonia-lyase
VHGATRSALGHVREVLEIEMNSATDNPLLVLDAASWDVISCGNFHGQPVSAAMDYLGLSVCGAMGMSERRTERLLNPISSGLPAFLTERGGLNSGFMLLQYTAAALVSESKILASPASVDSIPVSAGQEDHVSMGTIAARKARDISKNACKVLAIELICAAQAADFAGAALLSPAGGRVYELVREHSRRLEEDRVMSGELDEIGMLVQNGAFCSQCPPGAGGSE